MAVSERTQIMRDIIANINNIKKECIGEMAPVPNKPHTHYTAHLKNNTQFILLKKHTYLAQELENSQLYYNYLFTIGKRAYRKASYLYDRYMRNLCG